jgi:hypothetical protein
MELLLYLFIRKVEISLDLLHFHRNFCLTKGSTKVTFSLIPLQVQANTLRLFSRPDLLMEILSTHVKKGNFGTRFACSDLFVDTNICLI